jgi:elongation factor 1-beta
MANVLVTIKIMPESPDVDLGTVANGASARIAAVGLLMKTEQLPIAFGLKALMLTFLMDEAKGSTEPLENELAGLQGVGSVDVTDVRRAIG